MFDLAYSQLLDTNQELRSELQDEIFINKSNEKKVRSLVKELEQCYRTISLQDNTIIAHEKEIEKLKSEISDLRKQLRVLQQDKKFKDEVGSIQDGRIIELENKVGSLKARIRILIDKKISINALDMATTNLIANINRGLERIENHIRGAGTPMQNPANVIDGIRGSLNTIRVTLQNITAERDQYQNILNDTNNRERDLGNQLRDSRNQNLRLQRLLDESRVRVERTVRERDNAQGERNLAMLAYNNERQESRRWMFSYRDKDRHIQELLREKFAKQLLYRRDTNRLQQNTQQLQTNAQNQVNRMLVIIARKQTRIGELLREKFVFQLVNGQRDQNILNLQGQILALQNNPPNIQHIGMAGYPPPKFHGLAGEDPADYIRDLRQWCEASPNHDPNAGHQHRIRIDGLFESGLKDYARDWYETEIKGRNWELHNISDNTGLANIGAINGLANNNALRAINANQFRGGALHIRNTVPADNNAIANPIVPGHTVWEEDWSISGGCPTLLAPNAPNANAGGNVIVLGMFVGQKIHTFLHDFPTVTAEKSKVKFQSLVQGNDPVGRFYTNLKRMVKLAYPLLPAINQDELVKQQFFHGLKPDNQIEVRRIGLETPLPALIKKLEEIERYSAQQILGTTLHQPSHKTNSQGSSSAEIDKLKSEIASLRTQLAQPAQVHPQNNEALEKMYIRAVRLGMSPDAPRDLTSLDNYINDELIRRLGVANANYAKLSKQINAVKKLHKSGCKPACKTSKTKKKKSKNKSKKKKSKSGRVHTARVDEQSDSDSSDNDTSSSESEDSSSSSESSSSESESEAEADAEINVNISRVKKK